VFLAPSSKANRSPIKSLKKSPKKNNLFRAKLFFIMSAADFQTLKLESIIGFGGILLLHCLIIF
jgi:hypothetical protein